MPSPFVELLTDLGAVLDALGLDWYLFGAQAAGLYGTPRVTADVDVTVRLGALGPRALVSALEAGGFEARFDDEAFISQTRVIPLVHRETGLPADLVLAGPGLEDLFFERVRTRDFGAVTIPVAALEDLVVMKILAGRPKDLGDVESMIAAAGEEMDPDLVRETLGTLERALDQSDLRPAFERALTRAAG